MGPCHERREGQIQKSSILIIFKAEFTIFIIFLPLALIVSSLQVVLRDIKYIAELLLMAWLYFSPGFYSLKTVADISDNFFEGYMLNPFAGLFCFFMIEENKRGVFKRHVAGCHSCRAGSFYDKNGYL